jgi:O-antigen ligase
MAVWREIMRQGAMTASPPLMTTSLSDACERGLNITLVLFLPVLALVPHAVAPLVAFAGLMALGRAWPLDRAALYRIRVPAALCLAIVIWGTVSAAWAIAPGRSLLIAARLAGLFAAGLAMALVAGRLVTPARLAALLLAGGALALLLAEAQFATDGALTRPFFEHRFVAPNLNQLSEALAILALPVAAMLVAQRRRMMAAGALILAAAAVYHFVGSAAKAGFAVALISAALFYLCGRKLAHAAAALSVIVILTAPLTFPRLAELPIAAANAEQVKFSLWHRLQIWSFVGDRIAERPLFGWGLDASRAIPHGTEELRPGAQRLPLHPHNAALQIWLECGLPGALLFAGLAAWLWLALAKTAWPPLYTAAAAGALATAFFASLGTYGIWQEWWIATLSLALFVILAIARLAAPSNTAPERTTAVSPSSAPRPARSRTSP